MGSFSLPITFKTVHACPPNFEVSFPIFECRMQRLGLETAHKGSSIYSNIPTECSSIYSNIPTECSSKSCKFHSRLVVFFARELFKRRFQDSPWRSSRFELECSGSRYCSKWDVRREAKRFVSASNRNELKGKGKTRYTPGVYLALPFMGLSGPSPEKGQGLHGSAVPYC